MSTLILPVSGASSRFPGMRPKWLLTMPDGSLMIETSISKVSLSNIDQIVIVALKRHLDQYISKATLEKLICDRFGKHAIVVPLDTETSCQAETVALGIDKARITGDILIKDCDNVFSVDWRGGNFVGVLNLNETQLIKASNKSYVKVNDRGHITDIVEKNVISNLFCVGAYGFECAEYFVDTANELIASFDHEVYISHVIFEMLLRNEIFKPLTVGEYVDFGTLDEYRSFQRETVTIFCDLDGVLFENGSKFGKKGWKTNAISQNIIALREKLQSPHSTLIVTTSRPETEKEYIGKVLSEFGVFPDHWIFNLPHCKRTLINDFSRTNPFPSAVAINLPRDSDDLELYLNDS